MFLQVQNKLISSEECKISRIPREKQINLPHVLEKERKNVKIWARSLEEKKHFCESRKDDLILQESDTPPENTTMNVSVSRQQRKRRDENHRLNTGNKRRTLSNLRSRCPSCMAMQKVSSSSCTTLPELQRLLQHSPSYGNQEVLCCFLPKEEGGSPPEHQCTAELHPLFSTCILPGCDGGWWLLTQHGQLRVLAACSNRGKISLYAEKCTQEQKKTPAHESEDNNTLVNSFG